MMKAIIKGFSFGLVLQVAVGPLFVYIISTALIGGFWTAFGGVLAVTLADALFVALAILGIGRLITGNKAQTLMKIIGGVVIIIFGLAVFLSGFNIHLIPSFMVNEAHTSSSVFITSLVLTLSSPLTIVFCAGVFGARLAQNDGNIKKTALFGLGAVLSTLIFLTLASAIAGLFTSLISEQAIRVLNIIAGLILIGFGFSMLLYKKKTSIS